MSIDTQADVHSTEAKSASPSLPANTGAEARTAARKSSSGAWWKIGIGVLAVVAVAALMLRQAGPTETANLLTHTVGREDLQLTITEDGALESATNKEIKCEVKGGSTILWIIPDGSEVKPGDELVRLDASTIEDNISQQQITYETALSNKIQAESDLAVAEINITEYLEGTFRRDMKTAQMNVAIAEENLRVAKDSLNHAEKMFRKGYVSQLELDSKEYALQHATFELELMNTEVEVLDKFTKPKTLQELESAEKAARAKLASEEAALTLEETRLARLKKQLDGCVVNAETNGIVIYPETEEWKNEPAIEEGATVREQQTLLQVPDLSEMQVKVGIHESKVKQLKVGLPARIEIQDKTYDGKVVSIATQVSPTGWWDGNVRRFETVVKLVEQPDVRPGMSAEVEIIVAQLKNVLTVPVAAVVENKGKFHCWVETDEGVSKKDVKLGGNNDQFIEVKDGLADGDRVVLNPRDFIDQERNDALMPLEEPENAIEAEEKKGELAEQDKPTDEKLPATTKKEAVA